MTFPLELCFTPDRLHDTLRSYYKGKCGYGHVQLHKYSISTKDGNSLVEADNWGSVVKKGTVLVMSMMLEKLALEWGHRWNNLSPTIIWAAFGRLEWGQHQNTCPTFGDARDTSVPTKTSGATWDSSGWDDSVTEFRNIRIVLVGLLVREPVN
ncbi:hypothetical protein BYT27DRAFT_6755686 [Phlegmacium glaucopus]|nr:hypothetical protein BYT27DRAFT_6755686 [Phlegmacium glaucopus]